MSSGGGTMAAAPIPIASGPKASSSSSSANGSAAPPQPRRKPVTENWDDDFEFSIPVKPKTAKRPSPVSTPKREPTSFLGEGRVNGVAAQDSPDSFDEDWDEPLSGPSRSTPAPSPARPVQRSPAAGPSTARLVPPRSSQSHSPTLPSPTTPNSTTWKTLGFPSQQSSTTSLATARPGDSTPRPSLSKRSSTSFVPVRQGDASPLTPHKQSSASRSSPSLSADGRLLHGSTSLTSLRRVPVPAYVPTELEHSRVPSPTRRFHSPAKSVSSATVITTSPIRVVKGGFQPSPSKGTPVASASLATKREFSSLTPPAQSIKPAPSTESLREKRPSFWKRLSSGGSSSKDSSPDKSPGRRKRSTSVGAGLVQPDNDEPIPPLPPLPANLRSSSGTMASPTRLPSNTSVHSSSSKSKKRITAPFMMRRTSSNTSYAVDSPSKPGVARPDMLTKGVRTSSPAKSVASSINSTPSVTSPERLGGSPLGFPNGEGSTSRKASGPRPRTFSPGFHLPSPSPGSPYSQIGSNAQSESETEEMEQPKSRRRVRPASAMPVPRPQGGANITPNLQASASLHSLSSAAGGTSMTGTSAPRNVHMPTLEALSRGTSATSRQPSATSQAQLSSSPTSTTRSVSSSHQSMVTGSPHSSGGFATLRRLTSFSKRHRRRLSNGWKFGTQSSASSSGETGGRPTSQHLATVEGSPSKPSSLVTDHLPAGATPRPSAPFPSDDRLELGSPPRSNPRRQHPKSMASLQVMPQHRSDSPSHVDWDETTRSRNGVTRERRRLSFNDFVIPDQVLAKQKELKRGIGAVKKFAGGVQTLKSLVGVHDMVCDNVLATGTQDDMKLFVALENEYTQWWEMATVLIEVGSTGTEDATTASFTGPGPVPVRPRRITLATEDARAAGEALSSISSRGGSYSTVKSSIFTDASGDVFGSSDFSPEDPPKIEADGPKHDLSQRQLEVLRTMLRTPVSASDSVVPTVDQRQALKARMRQSMPVAPTNVREILPSGPATVRASNGPLKQTPPVNKGSTLPVISPETSYVVPSPSYPSPDTASNLAQPKNKTGGLAGLRDFLRSLRANNTSHKSTKSKSSSSDLSSSETPKARPSTQQPRHRPAPINTEAASKWGHSPPASPLPSAGSNEPMMYSTRGSEMGSYKAPIKLENKKRRPSLKTIFRPGSGNWHELVRPTTPGSPLPTIPSQGTPDEPKTSVEGSSATPSRTRAGTLARPPSIPALARLKLTKPYGSISVDSPNGSPTKPRHRPSVGQADAPPAPPILVSTHSAPAVPSLSSVSSLSSVPSLPSGTPPHVDGDATLRLKSRVLGLGYPSENSPSRTTSSPARTTPSELTVPDEMPRSRSDGGVRDSDDPVIALTPENLPVLLDYVKQCEKKLQEWRTRAVGLEKNKGLVLTTT